ncbi:MAG: chemotaxis protein CheD [Nitrospirota bacterium]|nr:chemotaxis protein CheD [Nitrospirota bacterium]
MGTGTETVKKEHFLYPGTLFAKKGEYTVSTILGSCVSVCLWDPVLKFGGINHYMLPLWNGEGLPSPKYGNIAISKLIENMLGLGCKKSNLKAKVFGGGEVLNSSGGILNISARNIELAWELLKEEGIPIISSEVGGNQGRKLIFNTESGTVLLRKVQKTMGK